MSWNVCCVPRVQCVIVFDLDARSIKYACLKNHDNFIKFIAVISVHKLRGLTVVLKKELFKADTFLYFDLLRATHNIGETVLHGMIDRLEDVVEWK